MGSQSAMSDRTFERFYTDRYGQMVRTAALITGSAAVAEEIVQDTFVQMYRLWDEIDSPPGWARAAVVSGCRSWQRRVVRERTHAERFGPAEAGTDALVASDANAIAVRASLQSLTDRQRAAVVLRYFEDLPEAEIARLLGCRPGTVKSLLSRSLAKLKGVLDD